MDGAGDHLLARARFPVMSTVASEFAARAVVSRSLTMAGLLPMMLPESKRSPTSSAGGGSPPGDAVIHGLLHLEAQFVEVQGLGQVLVGPLLHGIDGGLHRGVGGHDDHRDCRLISFMAFRACRPRP